MCCFEESIVRCHFSRGFPDTLDGIEFRRIWRQAVKLNELLVCFQPFFAVFFEPMVRRVINYEENFSSVILLYKLLQKFEKRMAVEDVCESIMPFGFAKTDCTKDVSGFALSIGVYTRLLPDSRPCLVQCTVEPETGFVFE